MKLTEIEVDGFGSWRDLSLRKLSPEITVFYGPNEAGKTTLMHFLRSMLYGVTAERRERYLPPREGGRPGGTIGVVTDDGPFDVSRHAERGDDDLGRVVVTLGDGEEQGDRLLREALEAVDERTFTNVFAIGLDEINELAALEGAEAAKSIYRLTSGLDRVSLYDVIQGLRSSRRELIGAAGEPSVMADLFARRERLQTEIDALAVGNRRWAKLCLDIDDAAGQEDRLETELKEAERRARRVEIAVGLKPLWSDRNRALEDRAAFNHLIELPEDALSTLDHYNAQSEEHQRRRDVLRGQRRQIHEEIQELGVNEVLVRSCCRLDALGEQQEWLEALERRSEELTESAERLEARAESEAARLAKLWRHKPKPDEAPELDDEALGLLAPAAELYGEADALVAEARRELDRMRNRELEHQAKMESALTSSDKLGLPKDIESAGDLVALLRRRLKAEQRVESARRQANDLQLANGDVVERQVLSTEWFAILTVGFVISGLVTVWPLLSGAALNGWSLLGFLACLGLMFIRYAVEDHAANQFDTTRQQIDVAARQITEAERERGALDAELPMQEGSVKTRLQAAERHLEELERMVPVEADRRRATQQTASAEAELKTAEKEFAAAAAEWKTALRSVGLPDETTPSELEKLAAQHRGLAELRAKLESIQEEVERCELEYGRVVKRITGLAEEADLVVEEAEPLEQLEALLSEKRLQQSRIDHRKKLKERARELRDQQRKHARAADRVDEQREALFRSAQVDGEESYRKLAADWDEVRRLDERFDRLTREIGAAIGPSGDETDFAELLKPDAIGRLEEVWAAACKEHEETETRLRDAVAARATLQAQRDAMVEDTSLADKRVELGLVEGQIAETRDRWRERAAVGAMLELIRNDYEEHRQPETLVEASRFLERLTRGRYPRVWTPLADDVLLVDNRDGESLRVENLSRGAREQLFLSVRLALVAMYARRGVQLPMVLDDVLVNFDDGRARIAAEVLTDFAKDGHQLCVFTCHEHVWRMFKDLDVDVRRLPLRDGVEEPEVAEEEPIEEPIEEVVEAPPVEEPVEEVIVERPRKRRKRKPDPAMVEAVYDAIEPKPDTYETVYDRVTRAVSEPGGAAPNGLTSSDWVEVVYERPYGEAIEPIPAPRLPEPLVEETPPTPRAEDEVSWLDEAEAAWGNVTPAGRRG